MIKFDSLFYTNALLDYAIKNNKVQLIYDQIVECYNIFKDNDELIKAEVNGIITSAQAKQMIGSFYPDEFDPYIMFWIFTIIDNKHFNWIINIFKAALKGFQNTLGINFLKIYTPFDLDTEVIKKITTIFEKKSKTALDVVVIKQEDLLGGIVVKYNNQTYNYSISEKLKEISRASKARLNGMEE